MKQQNKYSVIIKFTCALLIIIPEFSFAQTKQITNAPASEYHAKWFPGTNDTILYTYNDQNDIKIMWHCISSGDEALIPIQRKGHFHFDFTSDGKKMIFDGFEGNEPPYCLFIYDFVDQSTSLFKRNSGYPSISPDGQKVVYSGPGSNLYISNIDGTNTRNLTNFSTGYEISDWSPDGKRIAITSERSGNSDIWIINEDGTGLTQLTTHPGRDYWPSWSPDGRKIAFTSVHSNNYDIWIVDVETKELHRFTIHETVDNQPEWSANGKSIMFSSGRAGTQDIWIKEIASSNIKQEENGIPNKFNLHQNYPNPFNPSTKITFTLAESGNVNLKILNLLGETVTTLLNENMAAGNHEINFIAHNLTSGVYVAILQQGEFTATHKMILLQ